MPVLQAKSKILDSNNIYKRQKDSFHLNFYLVACEFSLLMFQLGHGHENRFYHTIVQHTVRLKKDHKHIKTDPKKD